MESKEIQRKIAVIFATDVVSYSKSIENDEEGTIKTLRVCRKILDDLFQEHDGRIFNTAGDSVLAEFSSAVSAVICAAEFQKLIAERNAQSDTTLKMEFRIGINMGDVVVEGENLYGEGVNIAARLEALAQPNGISLSRSIHDLITKKIDLVFNDLGEQSVKENRFHAFDVVLDSKKRRKPPVAKKKSPMPVALAVAAVLLIGAFGYYKYFMEGDGEPKEVTASDRPVVLVMPFANESGDKEQNYLGMGITSNLITTLSHFDQLLVLAKTTGEYVLANKVPKEEIVSQYGVSYVLNGSTQSAGSKVRINVELVDMASDSVIWSEAYDFSEKDIFDIQDQVSDSVLGHLGLEVIEGSVAAVSKWKTPEALKNEVLCIAAFNKFSKEGHYEAERLCDANVILEPNNPYAITAQGWVLHQKVLLGLSENVQDDLQTAYKLANKVKKEYPDYVLAIQLASTVEIILGDHDKGCGQLENMTSLSKEIISVVTTAWLHRVCGEYPASIETFEKAFKISPHYSSWIKVDYMYALLQNGEFEKAKKYALQQIENEHSYSRGDAVFRAQLAYIYKKFGDEASAQKYYEAQKTMKEGVTKSSIEARDFSMDRSSVFADDYIAVLQSLGMPDK